MDSKEEIYGFQIHPQEHDPDFKNTVSPQIMHTYSNITCVDLL